MPVRPSLLGAAVCFAVCLALSPAPAPAAGHPVTLRPAAADKPVGPDELAIRWLGTAGFAIRTATTTVLIDPYFSRPPLWQLLTSPIAPDLPTIRRYVGKTDAVFIGHGHFDHLLDAPTICKLTGARLYGSIDSLRLARAEGVPWGQLTRMRGGETIRVGDLEIVPVRSLHSEVATQWIAQESMPAVIKPPLGFLKYGAGQAFGFWIRWRGRTLYHCGSAQIVESELQGRQAEVLMVCLAGWKSSTDLWGRIQRSLHPQAVIPIHYDNFFRPLTAPLQDVMFANRPEALAKIREAMPTARIVQPALLQEYRISPGIVPSRQ
jgi:L-ascorbate metabolism protein UlaG (beta-lactamase superfamily)